MGHKGWCRSGTTLRREKLRRDMMNFVFCTQIIKKKKSIPDKEIFGKMFPCKIISYLPIYYYQTTLCTLPLSWSMYITRQICYKCY